MMTFKVRALTAGLLALFLGTIGAAQEKSPQRFGRGGRYVPGVRSAALTDQGLANLLRDMGFEPKAEAVKDGMVFHLTIPRDSWTFRIRLSLSPNKRKVWLNTPLVNLSSGGAFPSGLGEKLLEANLRNGPAHFYLNPENGWLFLGMALDNRGLTAGELRYELDYFLDRIRLTSPLWRSASPVDTASR